MNLKNHLEDYTEEEFLEIINSLFSGQRLTEEIRDSIVDHIVELSEHPNGTDIIFYPEPSTEDSPQGVLKTIKEWRAQNGKPGFKYS